MSESSVALVQCTWNLRQEDPGCARLIEPQIAELAKIMIEDYVAGLFTGTCSVLPEDNIGHAIYLAARSPASE